jgi:endonuclease III
MSVSATTSTAANVTRYVDPVAKPRTPKGRARLAMARLAALYPGTAKELCALDFDTPFQLLAATILSAQSTDARVNMVTPALFAAYPEPADLAAADPEKVEELVRSTGFFRSKTKSLIGMAAAVAERYGGEVPQQLAELVTIPGVGRKTANVVRSVAFGLPGLPVDTHVLRLSRRLGLTDGLAPAQRDDAVKVELELNSMIPAAERGAFSLRLILHGRAVCLARKPHCNQCSLADFCPSSTV